MLREPSMRVKRNSSEYASIMKSISDVKKVLRNEPDNEKAKAAYVKTVNKVLNNINRYRVHKAKDGVNEKDATYDKIIAMTRSLPWSVWISFFGPDISPWNRGNMKTASVPFQNCLRWM